MKVRLLDLAAEHAPIRPQIDAAVARVLDSASFIMGPDVAAFEEELASVLETRHAVAVSSGTDALLIALMALGIGPGDEVLTTPFSFFATAGVIARLGATPVFADIDPRTLNLDASQAAGLVSHRTRAIMPVHLFGLPATAPEIDGVATVEDSAQAIGVPLRGDLATLSFFPAKNLGACGDAGAVITNDATLAERMRRLRQHGAHPKYFHEVIGGNFRIDTLQAAILRVKLPGVAAATAARRANAARYRELFRGARVPAEVQLPPEDPAHVYNQFVLRAPRRDALRDALARAGVESAVYYPRPLHLQGCFAHLGYEAGSLPVAEQASDEVLAIPVQPRLEPSQLEYVVEQIEAFYRRG